MTDMNDLAEKKANLAALEDEIAAATERFEESIADLRLRCETLRAEYLGALRTEMESAQRPPVPSLGGILAAIEHTPQPVIVRRIRQRAVSYLVGVRRERGPEAGFMERGPDSVKPREGLAVGSPEPF
jgi:hypothetical protein